MFTLILVFGTWINPTQINQLRDWRGDCNAYFNSTISAEFEDKTCNEVVVEIKKQLAERDFVQEKK